jgi:hypothetical protein
VRSHVTERDRRASIGVRSTLRRRVVVGIAVAHSVLASFRVVERHEKASDRGHHRPKGGYGGKDETVESE